MSSGGFWTFSRRIDGMTTTGSFLMKALAFHILLFLRPVKGLLIFLASAWCALHVFAMSVLLFISLVWKPIYPEPYLWYAAGVGVVYTLLLFAVRVLSFKYDEIILSINPTRAALYLD